MPWNLIHHHDLQVIETCYSGMMQPQELRAAFDGTVALGRQHNVKLYLANYSELQGGHSVVDLYGLADLLAKCVTVPFTEAVLMPQLTANHEDVKFWETACRNRGMNVQIFAEKARALAWLCDLPQRGGG